MNNLAKNLLFLRKKRGLTQHEMPQLINISRVTWGNWENGNTEPDIDKILNISEIFRVRLDHLIIANLKENAHLIQNEEQWNKTKNALAQQNSMVNEEQPSYDINKKEEVNWLILEGINKLLGDMNQVKGKLGV